MASKILIVYLISMTLHLLTGGLLLGFPLIANASAAASPTINNVALNLILDRCPLTASTINAILIFLTVLLTLPALLLPSTRLFPKLQLTLLTTSALLSLLLGLLLWYSTLRTRSSLLPIYASLPSGTQSLLQARFSCCGYLSASLPEFVKDKTCTGVVQAALMQPCVGPLSAYANQVEDVVFTALFGVVGVDILAVLATAMVLKERGEREMYRWLDAKSGVGGF